MGGGPGGPGGGGEGPGGMNGGENEMQAHGEGNMEGGLLGAT